MRKPEKTGWFNDININPVRLLLTRHGETQWNAEHRIQGHTDLELSERGVKQAEALAERLAGAEVSAIYSSDLSRASRTAAIILERMPNGARHIITPLLRERNWGIFEGKTWEETEKELPEEIRRLRSHPLDFTPEGGESRGDVIVRINEFLNTLVTEHRGERVIAVTHGGVSSLMIKIMIGMDLSNITPFRVENCSVSVMDYVRENTWFVQCLNDMSHLDDFRII